LTAPLQQATYVRERVVGLLMEEQRAPSTR